MTTQLPNLELIASTHEFPGPFTFKIIGDAREDFVAEALTLAIAALGDDREFTHSTRVSSGGNHIALTLAVRMHNAEEVHAVYNNLLRLTGLRALF
jgi:putative lipoic acid-binding regulatory protein